MNVDPRLRVVFLLGVAVGAFLLKDPLHVAGLCVALVGMWRAVRLPWHRLRKKVFKLWGLAFVLVLSFGLTTQGEAVDRWILLPLGPASFQVNTAGALLGLTMVLRIVAIVLASQIVRAGDPRAIASGLGQLGAPRPVAGR